MGNYYLYCLGYWLTRILPKPLAYGFGVFISDLHFMFSKADRQSVSNNLKAILNTDHVDNAQVREVFRNFGRYLVDFFTMTKYLNKGCINKMVDVFDLEYVNDVLRHGKGGIIISAHLGNWEMGGAILPMMGYPLSILALPHQDPRVNKFFNDQREAFGSMIIPTAAASVRRCIEHLKRNRLVAIMVERDFTQHGVKMSFLGKPTMIPKGAAVFSIKTGAPLIPCFFLRGENDRFQISFGKPLMPPQVPAGTISDEVVIDYIKKYIPIVEEQIRKHPTQWLMFREFWIK